MPAGQSVPIPGSAEALPRRAVRACHPLSGIEAGYFDTARLI